MSTQPSRTCASATVRSAPGCAGSGPIEADARWRKSFDPVDALARAILYQQLSGKAAATIVGRVEAAIGSDRLHAGTLGRIDDVALRACGVSGNRRLPCATWYGEAAGEIPDRRRMATMQDVAIIDALVPTRGSGGGPSK